MVQLPGWISGLIAGSDEIARAAESALTALGVAVAAFGQPRGLDAEREELPPPTLDPAPTDAQVDRWKPAPTEPARR